MPDVEQNVARSANAARAIEFCSMRALASAVGRSVSPLRFATLRPTAAYAKCPSSDFASLVGLWPLRIKRAHYVKL